MTEIPCYGQYFKNGNCTETEKPSGRIHPCPVEHGGECYLNLPIDNDNKVC